MKLSFGAWYKSGSPWIWLNAGAVAISVVMVIGVMLLIAVRGLGHFWPSDVAEANYVASGEESFTLIGEFVESEEVSAQRLRDNGVEISADSVVVARHLFKTGNRDITGGDFRWILDSRLQQVEYPDDIFTIERSEWGHFYGYIVAIKEDGKPINTDNFIQELNARIVRVGRIKTDIRDIEHGAIGSINHNLERLRLKERGLKLSGRLSVAVQADISAEKEALNREYTNLQGSLNGLYKALARDVLVARTMTREEYDVPISTIVRAYQANKMSTPEKTFLYLAKLWEFLSDVPREANTEGGVFPAIFGTVLMVLLMSIIVTPFGVVAAVYLREYAKQGLITKTIRIAVNNLAGVPSIVYGVFGLGFFVYFIGGSVDRAFFPEALPAPTFGTSGLLWASLTLALLTVPVVIVATEEGLARIPRSMREGSLALGATKAETLWKVVLPMASPAMMTGVILAVARAAGEVAPLMLVGVVKLAPELPINGNYPFLHLDQKFMHLGFHIYDVGFQSPNVEAARPLVYATALLLVAVIALLNVSAISIRNHLREKYKALEM